MVTGTSPVPFPRSIGRVASRPGVEISFYSVLVPHIGTCWTTQAVGHRQSVAQGGTSGCRSRKVSRSVLTDYLATRPTLDPCRCPRWAVHRNRHRIIEPDAGERAPCPISHLVMVNQPTKNQPNCNHECVSALHKGNKHDKLLCSNVGGLRKLAPVLSVPLPSAIMLSSLIKHLIECQYPKCESFRKIVPIFSCQMIEYAGKNIVATAKFHFVF